MLSHYTSKQSEIIITLQNRLPFRSTSNFRVTKIISSIWHQKWQKILTNLLKIWQSTFFHQYQTMAVKKNNLKFMRNNQPKSNYDRKEGNWTYMRKTSIKQKINQTGFIFFWKLKTINKNNTLNTFRQHIYLLIYLSYWHITTIKTIV